MALYYDAAKILSTETKQGSLKSLIYGATASRSNPAQLFALIAETAKRNAFLKEVIDNAELLLHEPKLTPILSLLLCHDHFFSKSGIAAPQQHSLRQAVEKHRSRLQSEFTRARLRRRCGSVEALKKILEQESKGKSKLHPRWVRVNTLLAADTRDALVSVKAIEKKQNLHEVLALGNDTSAFCGDTNVPYLLAVSPETELTKTDAYRTGKIILQDKASCFPACLLLGDQEGLIGDVMDGCAAPGNKTTHLAAILATMSQQSQVFACERDTARSKTLVTMVKKAAADKTVTVLEGQDFLAIDPAATRFQNVTHMLLDPSCSGSGILRREDIPILDLPGAKVPTRLTKADGIAKKGKTKKRKREDADSSVPVTPSLEEILPPDQEEATMSVTAERLQKLSNLQTHIVEHAMSFSSATRITYSTCSIHEQENEVVVSRLLASSVAKARGWELLSRSHQVEGMRVWKHRGVRSGANEGNTLSSPALDACIRCNPDDDEGTMGFFVCAFVRKAPF